MAVTINDELQGLFFPWVLGRREIIWLWMYLQSAGAHFHPASFDTRDTRTQLADYIKRNDLVAIVNNQRYHSLLPDRVFDWIDKNGRQPGWLLRTAQHTYGGDLVFPDVLTPRECLVAWFDLSNAEKTWKLDVLKWLKESSVEKQLQDKALSWYASAGKEKQKCEIAWMWYQQHHSSAAAQAMQFSRLEDILEFLDHTAFSYEEKLHHLEQIKKRFKAKQTYANRRGKRQTNLSLSEVARIQLDQLAERERMSKTEIIELLIQRAHEIGSLN